MLGKQQLGPLRLTILMPVYNDWQTAILLINKIDALTITDIFINVLLVDDGSTDPYPESFSIKNIYNISNIEILQLNRNLSHQRAIAIGLTHIKKAVECDAVLVMDSDGEDLPEDIFNLVESFEKKGRKMAVFAKRAKRSESWLFKLCYRAYLFSNWLFIGKIFKVGNFSIIPYDYLAPLVVSAELWNHYAATVFKLRLPVDLLPISRGVRLHGKSKMNFVSLIVHGLSAISVFGEIVGTRFFILFFSISTIFMALVVSGLLVLFSTDMTLSCHVAYGIGLILLLLSNGLGFVASFLLSLLGNRNLATFLPIRDYRYFIKRSIAIHHFP